MIERSECLGFSWSYFPCPAMPFLKKPQFDRRFAYSGNLPDNAYVSAYSPLVDSHVPSNFDNYILCLVSNYRPKYSATGCATTFYN